MTGWLIALGILVLLAILPVGVCLIYDEDGLILSLLLGTVRIKLFPKASKEDKKKKKEKPKKQKKKDVKAALPKTKPAKKEKSGGKITDFLPLVDVGLRFLGSFRRKLRVKRLELNYVMAGGDPCDLALSYGKAWTAVGNLMPLLERIFVIKKRNIQVQCDFAADSAKISARLEITITIGRMVGIAVKYGVKALCEFLKIKNKNKGGAKK